MKKLSLYKDDNNYSRNTVILNQIIELQWWLNSNLNPEAGTVEPDPKYTGMLAYADGVLWNPGATGQGIYWWDGAAWNKL